MTKAGDLIKNRTKTTGVSTISNLAISLHRMIDPAADTVELPILTREGPTVTVTTATWAASAWAGDERISDSEGTIMEVLKRKAIEEHAKD